MPKNYPVDSPVYERLKGEWFFHDETGCRSCGPYLTETEALAAVEVYAREHLEGSNTPTPKWWRF